MDRERERSKDQYWDEPQTGSHAGFLPRRLLRQRRTNHEEQTPTESSVNVATDTKTVPQTFFSRMVERSAQRHGQRQESRGPTQRLSGAIHRSLSRTRGTAVRQQSVQGNLEQRIVPPMPRQHPPARDRFITQGHAHRRQSASSSSCSPERVVSVVAKRCGVPEGTLEGRVAYMERERMNANFQRAMAEQASIRRTRSQGRMDKDKTVKVATPFAEESGDPQRPIRYMQSLPPTPPRAQVTTERFGAPRRKLSVDRRPTLIGQDILTVPTPNSRKARSTDEEQQHRRPIGANLGPRGRDMRSGSPEQIHGRAKCRTPPVIGRSGTRSSTLVGAPCIGTDVRYTTVEPPVAVITRDLVSMVGDALIGGAVARIGGCIDREHMRIIKATFTRLKMRARFGTLDDVTAEQVNRYADRMNEYIEGCQEQEVTLARQWEEAKGDAKDEDTEELNAEFQKLLRHERNKWRDEQGRMSMELESLVVARGIYLGSIILCGVIHIREDECRMRALQDWRCSKLEQDSVSQTLRSVLRATSMPSEAPLLFTKLQMLLMKSAQLDLHLKNETREAYDRGVSRTDLEHRMDQIPLLFSRLQRRLLRLSFNVLVSQEFCPRQKLTSGFSQILKSPLNFNCIKFGEGEGGRSASATVTDGSFQLTSHEVPPDENHFLTAKENLYHTYRLNGRGNSCSPGKIFDASEMSGTIYE